MSASHGKPIRGLSHTPRTAGFSGTFGRMFPSLRPATFGRTDAETEANLLALGAAMSAAADPADPKDGPDDEESGIPALYTYFGQFIDHDLTFDPASSLQKQNDPDALIDYRTPAFDLDNLYGRGPDDEPFMYQEDGKSFLLGDPLEGSGDPEARDLTRNSLGRALIGDPRNDENSIVSQLQGLFQRFHNRIAKEMIDDNPNVSFEAIQEEVRFHYQHVLLNDFLSRIVDKDVLDELRAPSGRFDPSKLRFFGITGPGFIPVEFSVAAYRLGHSMVRAGYRLNDNIIQPIFPTPGKGPGLTGFKSMLPGWGIDWGRFIDIDVRSYGDTAGDAQQRRLQFAYRLDTSLVNPLSNLPATVAGDPPPSLASRNLIRGWRLGLPSGQHVARRMGVRVLPDSEILIGMGVDKPDTPLGTVTDVSPIFAGNCPLWTYILAEAMQHKVKAKLPVTEDVLITTSQLGPVGGRIVAEVFVGLMHLDKKSLFHASHWRPKFSGDYKLKDLVAYALGH